MGATRFMRQSPEVQNYLAIARTGFYPLFVHDWIKASTHSPIAYKHASINVKLVFETLARHKTSDRKKTALMQMDQEKRDQFIASFLKLVEYTLLENNERLH